MSSLKFIDKKTHVHMLPTSLNELSDRTQMNKIITSDNQIDNSKDSNKFNNHHNFRLGIANLLNRSTIHGLTHISTASNDISRFIWLILWLIGVAGFLTNLSYIVEHYLSHPILTSYINDYEPFQWPDMIFCNPMAPYNVHTKHVLWNYYVNLARNLSNHIPNHLFMSIEELDTNEIIVQSLIHSTLSYWEFNVGNVEDMFQFVASDSGYQGIRLSVALDENLVMIPMPLSKYFYTQILQKRYNVPCLNFQISRHLNAVDYQRIEKFAFGIKFNYQSYLIINSSYTSHMIDLYITLPNHFPHMQSIELTPGYINHIELDMIRTKRLKQSTSSATATATATATTGKCYDQKFSALIYDGDFQTKRLIYGNSEFCHRILSQYLYFTECHCYSPFLPYGYYNNHNNHSQPNLCLNMSIFNAKQLADNVNCMYGVFQKYSNTSLYMSLIEAKQCDNYRISPYCDHVQYNHLGIRRIAMTELWTDTYNEARAAFLINTFRDVFIKTNQNNNNVSTRNTIKNTTTFKQTNVKSSTTTTQEILTEMRNNFGLLTIERSSPQGKLVREEQEYSLAQLLSDIGGNMGLWIGISVIGLFEFVEFIGFILYSMFNYLIRLCRKIENKFL